MAGKHIVIVGAGVGGLAAAVRLAAQGQRVTLLEKLDRVGGKVNLWTAPHPHRASDERPFRFDTGPSLLTLPLVFADLFAFAGRDVREHLSVRRLDPVSRFVWRDGASLELFAARDALLREVARFAPDDARGFEKLLKRGKRIYDIAGETFLTQAPEQALRGDGAFSPLNALRMLLMPWRIGMFDKYAKLIDRHVHDPRLRHVLYQYATYSGASPQLAPATLAVIPHVELEQGGFYVEGGMYAIATALEKLARELGVQIRVARTVKRIRIEDTIRRARETARVKGVELDDGSFIDADAVLVNADVVWAYRHLIDETYRPRFNDARLDQLEPGGSGMALLLGVEGTYPQLAHHTKFMPDDYASELRAMFETHAIPDDPCIYVCAPTRTDPTQAPEGCENLFVLCSSPAIDTSRPIDWNAEGQAYRDRIIATLENRFGLTDLSKRIVVERRMTPVDLKTLYNANAGSIYGISSNGVRAAFLRPPNRDRDIQGLFFAGAATHPGGGLPLVALSGKIASELAMEYLSA